MRKRARTHAEAAAAAAHPAAEAAPACSSPSSSALILTREADAKVGAVALRAGRHELVVVWLAREWPAGAGHVWVEAGAAASWRLERRDGVPACAGRVEAARRGVEVAGRGELRRVHEHASAASTAGAAADDAAARSTAAAKERGRAEEVGRGGEGVEVGRAERGVGRRQPARTCTTAARRRLGRDARRVNLRPPAGARVAPRRCTRRRRCDGRLALERRDELVDDLALVLGHDLLERLLGQERVHERLVGRGRVECVRERRLGRELGRERERDVVRLVVLRRRPSHKRETGGGSVQLQLGQAGTDERTSTAMPSTTALLPSLPMRTTNVRLLWACRYSISPFWSASAVSLPEASSVEPDDDGARRKPRATWAAWRRSVSAWSGLARAGVEAALARLGSKASSAGADRGEDMAAVDGKGCGGRREMAGGRWLLEVRQGGGLRLLMPSCPPASPTDHRPPASDAQPDDVVLACSTRTQT